MAQAIPPPPDREPQVLTLDSGRVRRVKERVLAYDHPVFTFDAGKGDRLLLGLEDPSAKLVLTLEAPSGAWVLDGVRPAAGGLPLRLNETGRWPVSVRMEGDAARVAAGASFALTLERR